MEVGKGIFISEGMLVNFFNSLLNKSIVKILGVIKVGKGFVEFRKYRVMFFFFCYFIICYCICILVFISLIFFDYY